MNTDTESMNNLERSRKDFNLFCPQEEYQIRAQVFDIAPADYHHDNISSKRKIHVFSHEYEELLDVYLSKNKLQVDRQQFVESYFYPRLLFIRLIDDVSVDKAPSIVIENTGFDDINVQTFTASKEDRVQDFGSLINNTIVRFNSEEYHFLVDEDTVYSLNSATYKSEDYHSIEIPILPKKNYVFRLISHAYYTEYIRKIQYKNMLPNFMFYVEHGFIPDKA